MKGSCTVASVAVLVLGAGAVCSVGFAGENTPTDSHGVPVIIPPSGPGNPPFNGGFAPPIPFEVDNPGTFPKYDFGEAPDFAPLCDAPGLGFFPTRALSPSGTGGRSGPRHTDLSDSLNVLLGRAVTYETINASPQCDWLSAACDPSDDGLLLLCLDADCDAGIMISRGVCGLGFGASFGAAPPTPNPNGFFVVRTRTGSDYLGTNYLNLVADNNVNGTLQDFASAWAIRDGAVDFIPSHDQLHRSGSFPLFSYSGSGDDWSIGAFWARVMVSEERLSNSLSAWDGSGTSGPYQWGETEDWLVRTQLGRWLCRLPQSSVRTTVHAVISLDPADTECLNGVEFTINSDGQFSGKVRQFREATLQPAQPMPVEVTSLTVRGNIPELGGTVNLRERTDRLSMGVVDVFQTAAGALAEGDAFLDLSFAVDLLDIPRTLDTGTAFVRVEAQGLGAFPPVGVPFFTRTDATPLPLIDRATLQLAGWMCVLDIQFTQVTNGGCSGDANNDGAVNFGDITAVLANWGHAGADGDASGDCTVDFIDLTAVLASWDTNCP